MSKLSVYLDDVHQGKYKRPRFYAVAIGFAIVLAIVSFLYASDGNKLGESSSASERTAATVIAVLFLVAAIVHFYLFLYAEIGKMDRAIDKPVNEDPLDAYLGQQSGAF